MARNNRRSRKASLSVVAENAASTIATFDDQSVTNAVGSALGAQARLELGYEEHQLSDYLWQFAVAPGVVDRCKTGRTRSQIASAVESFMNGDRDFAALTSDLLPENLRGLTAIGIFEEINAVLNPRRAAIAA